MANKVRADRQGAHRTAFDHNKKIIFKTQNTCGICGREVDFTLKYPAQMAPVIDHIVPIIKGGHPSALENLQLAHNCCNRMKSDKVYEDSRKITPVANVVANNLLPLSRDWSQYLG